MSRVEEISRALNCRAGWRTEDFGVRRRSEVARRGVAIVNVVLLEAELMMFLDLSSFSGVCNPCPRVRQILSQQTPTLEI